MYLVFDQETVGNVHALQSVQFTRREISDGTVHYLDRHLHTVRQVTKDSSPRAVENVTHIYHIMIILGYSKLIMI